MTTAATLRGQLGATRRHYPNQIAAADDLRFDHDVVKARERMLDALSTVPAPLTATQCEHIDALIATMPPLTPEQLAKLRVLLPPVVLTADVIAAVASGEPT